LLFEAAPALFGVAVGALALGGNPRDRRRQAALLRASPATVAGLVTLVSEIVESVPGPAIAAATLALIAALVLIGVASRTGPETVRGPGRVALVIGLSTLPALLVGGLLAAANERLLELPLLVLALLRSLSVERTHGRELLGIGFRDSVPAHTLWLRFEPEVSLGWAVGGGR